MAATAKISFFSIRCKVCVLVINIIYEEYEVIEEFNMTKIPIIKFRHTISTHYLINVNTRRY